MSTWSGHGFQSTYRSENARHVLEDVEGLLVAKVDADCIQWGLRGNNGLWEDAQCVADALRRD